MYQQVTTLQAPDAAAMYVWFEPWAEGLGFPPGCIVELRGVSAVEGKLEVDVSSERTVVYGWAGSTLEVLIAGKVVHEFPPLPEGPTQLSMKEMVTMLFGPAPVPAPDAKPLWTKKI